MTKTAKKKKESKKSSMKDDFKDFLFTNQVLRKIRNILNQKFLPFFFKSIFVLVVLITLTLIAIRFFKPNYIENNLKTVYQKISFSFFHSLDFDDEEFVDITITGNNRASSDKILNIINEVHESSKENTFDNYQPFIKKLVIEIKKQLPWIDKITITRSIPNLLNIKVTEYIPFAIWQKGKEKFVADKNGNIVPINNISDFEDLIVLSGDKATKHVKSLFNIFVTDPSLSSLVYSATWSGDRRWDIRLSNGLLIKLPENNISVAWGNLIKIYNLPGSIVGLKVIDLRIDGKIYLEYADSVIKEIKSL